MGACARTVEGTADLLKEAVKANPEKFTSDLMSFVGARFIYVNHFFSGFQDAFIAEQILDWEKIFYFIIRYVQGDYFENNSKMPECVCLPIGAGSSALQQI